MILNDQEFNTTLERIARLQQQVVYLRRVETNVANFKGASSGFIAEIDRMQLDLREYLSMLPAEFAK